VRQHLTVEVIGPFAVRRCGIVLRGIEVGSRKARMLLALLAVERGRLVPIDRVVDALWGDAPPRRPAPDTATLVSRLRATLGPDTVTGGSSGYCLGVQVRVDLPDADRLVESAEAEPDGDHALVSARRALDLLEKGDVLADWPEAKWAEPARVLHTGLMRRARHAVAEAALRLGDPRIARDAAETALFADAFDEVACRMLMRAHAAAGEPARALLAYQRLRTTLAFELGADPAAQTRDLHLAILREMDLVHLG
jgi:DNA-binding SARP family transcriptional activator